MLKILSYLNGTRDLGITFCRDAPDELLAFADSPYAPRNDDRRSVSGGVVMCCGGPVRWFSRTQKAISLSSSEAEYIAMGECVKDVLFLQQIMNFIRPGAEFEPVTVYEDNSDAIHLANNPIGSARSKHIELRHHSIRDVVKRGLIRITHVESKLQHADALTKNLPTESFRQHRGY